MLWSCTFTFLVSSCSLCELTLFWNRVQLEAIRRRGPSKAKLKAGHVVEIGITENESDGEESDSDDSSEDEGSSDEEEDEEDEDDA